MLVESNYRNRKYVQMTTQMILEKIISIKWIDTKLAFICWKPYREKYLQACENGISLQKS